jgi:hypothetical protein
VGEDGWSFFVVLGCPGLLIFFLWPSWVLGSQACVTMPSSLQTLKISSCLFFFLCFWSINS